MKRPSKGWQGQHPSSVGTVERVYEDASGNEEVTVNFRNGQGRCFKCNTKENKDLWFGRPVDLERHAFCLKVGEKVQVE